MKLKKHQLKTKLGNYLDKYAFSLFVALTRFTIPTQFGNIPINFKTTNIYSISTKKYPN